MEKEMRELYVEGVAIHEGPELCAGVREGVGEALTGVRVGFGYGAAKLTRLGC
jgi:hypothetical protein